MMECPMDPVPLIVSIPVVGIAFAFGLAVLLQGPGRAAELQRNVRKQVGTDPATQVPYRATERQRALLDLDVSERLRHVPLLLGLSILLLIAYVVGELIPVPSHSLAYSCLITAGTVLTLAPPALSVLICVGVVFRLRYAQS
jgi:hypothetical protein